MVQKLSTRASISLTTASLAVDQSATRLIDRKQENKIIEPAKDSMR